VRLPREINCLRPQPQDKQGGEGRSGAYAAAQDDRHQQLQTAQRLPRSS
jgi:hypothetical protein